MAERSVSRAGNTATISITSWTNSSSTLDPSQAFTVTTSAPKRSQGEETDSEPNRGSLSLLEITVLPTPPEQILVMSCFSLDPPTGL